MRRPPALSALTCATLALAACSRAAHSPAQLADAGPAGASTATRPAMAPTGATPCGEGDGARLPCYRFARVEEAFAWAIASEPRVLAVGEAHAQRGSEGIASATKRFTESLLPMLVPRASDIVVELWAPDPKCKTEVAQVASAQKPVLAQQAGTNQNEYVVLGTKAKDAGVTPWLLRPTCDDFAALAAAAADASADPVAAMLELVKRLTLAKVAQLSARNAASDAPKMVVAYGGAMHNDLRPPADKAAYAFGPELDEATHGRYVELDLIVPELVQKTPAWEKLPWFPAFAADEARGEARDHVTMYVQGERSFVIVFPASRPSK